MEPATVSRPPWHIRRTGFPEAWRLAGARPTQQRPVRVGLLDSGVDLHHPLLRKLTGHGTNLLRPGEPPMDENGHGTHVAGIIALAMGALNGSVQGSGIPGAGAPVSGRARSPGVVLHPVKIFDQTGFGRIGDIVKGLYWCADQGMDIVNLSFGTDLKTSRALEQAVQDLEGEGLLLVAAAGNDGRKGAVDFPGRYPEAIAVSACTRTDRLAPFSSLGQEVDLIAPGAGVLSLAPGGRMIRMSGTSMAAPHVTAAAALLLGLEPHLSPQAVRQRIRSAAEWLPWVPTRAQGSGLLRADQTLRGRP